MRLIDVSKHHLSSVVLIFNVFNDLACSLQMIRVKIDLNRFRLGRHFTVFGWKINLHVDYFDDVRQVSKHD